MKTKPFILSSLCLALTSMLFIFSCNKKDDNIEEDNDTSSAVENTYAESIANDLVSIGDQAGWNTKSNTLNTYRIEENNLMIGCVDSIVRDTVGQQKKITVYFGNSICKDGRLRSGALRYSYSNGIYYRDSGLVITVTPIDYKVDGYAVSGSKTIENLGRLNGNFRWRIQANLSIVNPNTGGTFTWKTDRTRELLNTANVYNGPNFPITWTSAKIGITGNATGTSSTGITYSSIIQKQLVRDFNCAPDPLYNHRHPFISGVVDYKPGNKLTRTIDYGSGGCDLNATVTIKGKTFNIILK